jgi:hypothetical protein
MKKGIVQVLLLYCMLLCCCLHSQAQSEDARARDWMTLQRLSSLASLDSSFLTASDKKKLSALVLDLSPIAVCSKPSLTPCNGINPSSSGLKLTGVRINADRVKLEWQTIAENNTEGFVLERRSLTDTLRFDSIFYAKGQGTTIGKTKYGYIDQNSSSVETFYRVREKDLSGSFSYSNIVSIQGTIPKLAVQVAPNPATSSLAGFYVSGGTGSSITCIVINACGRLVLKKENLPVSGTTYFSLGAYHLWPGFYIVTVTSDNERISRKMIIY